MRIGLIVVGDEILSGRRTDKHMPHLLSLLKARGLVLNWVKIVGDEPNLLVDAFKASFATDDIVFSTGGIGGTPDDITRQAVAEALGVDLQHHPRGLEILDEFARERGRQLRDEHYRMVEFPLGARLIPNPVNKIPGFSMHKHHFVPGFPDMAGPMMEWVLDNEYTDLRNTQYVEEALLVYDTYESAAIPAMERVLAEWPAVKVFSLPIMDVEKPCIELGVKGALAEVKPAMALLKEELKAIGATWESG